MNFQEIRVLPAYQASEPIRSNSYLHLKICQRIDSQLPSDNVILKIAADSCGVTLDQIKSPTQTRQIVDARRLAIVWFYSNTNYSLSRIGVLFNGVKGGVKDHASVLNMLKKHAALIESDKSVQRQLYAFKESLIKYNPKCPTKMMLYAKSSKRKSQR